MRILRIKNYEKYQTHRTKNPKWIKLYLSLLTDRAFLQLDIRHRYLYVILLMLASETFNSCVNDVSYLSQRCFMDVSRRDIRALIRSGFIVASRSTKWRSERETETEREREGDVPAPEAPPPPQVVPLNGRKSRMLTEWPEDFMFNESHERLAAGYGLNVRAELANFRDKAIAKGWMNKDWNAAFRTWLTKAHEFKHGRLV